jgi:hypothetical protein
MWKHICNWKLFFGQAGGGDQLCVRWFKISTIKEVSSIMYQYHRVCINIISYVSISSVMYQYHRLCINIIAYVSISFYLFNMLTPFPSSAQGCANNLSNTINVLKKYSMWKHICNWKLFFGQAGGVNIIDYVSISSLMYQYHRLCINIIAYVSISSLMYQYHRLCINIIAYVSISSVMYQYHRLCINIIAYVSISYSDVYVSSI